MPTRTEDRLARDWHDLMGRYHRVTCQLDRGLEAEHGISSSDFEVLQELHSANDECSLRMQDLAHRVHLSQSALSRLVSRLESDGLLNRAACADDRRSVYLTITAKGRALYEAARPTQRRILREAR